jgi:hypothetical protein
MKKIVYLLGLLLVFASCSNNDDNGNDPVDDGPEDVTYRATLTFTQNWGGTEVTNQDYNSTVFTNDIGNELQITRLRYLISRVVLINADGQQFPLVDYQLVDLGNPNTNIVQPPIEIPAGAYRVAFVYGFNEEDNVSGQYSDLNTVLWNWPEDLGGGYHFMQLDGNYDVNNDPKPFNYHNGTARQSPGNFVANHVTFDSPQLTAVGTDVRVEITMDISEWFKDPNQWDLELLNTDLMGNFDAQRLMNANAGSVFSVRFVIDE